MSKLWVLLVLIMVAFSGNQYLLGQIIPLKLKDTPPAADTIYNFGEIPIKSAEITSKIRQEILDLLPEGTIKRLHAKNALLLASINPELLMPVDSTDPSKNISYLKARVIELTHAQRGIDEETTHLTGIVQNLDNIKNRLTRESVRWKNTRKIMEKDSLSLKVPVKLYETIYFLDSTLLLITQKSNAVIEILDKTIATGADISAQIEKARSLINTKQLQAFSIDHPAFFRLDFSTVSLKEILKSLLKFSRTDLEEFSQYLKANANAGFFTLVFLGLFIYLFVLIKKKVVIHEAGYGYFYKEMLMRVISNPVSASLILIMFLTIFIFPDRPQFFRELTFYVITIPLIQLTSNLLPKRYHYYIYAFGVLIFFYIFILIIPSVLVIYRVILLFVSIAEIVLLAMFVLSFDKKDDLEKGRKQLIYFFVYLHLGLAVVGFISNMAGRVTLTEMVLFAIFSNIFYGLAIFIASLLLNGLVVAAVDNTRGQLLNTFRMFGEQIKRKTIYVLNLTATLFLVVIILKNFLMLNFIYGGIISFFTKKLTIGTASFSLDSIVIFFIVIYVSVLVSALLRILLEEDVLKRFELAKGLPHTIAMMVRYTIIVAGFFLAVNAAGVPIDKLTIILGAFSVGIGFGLQNIFNNLVSGFILLLERPIQLGDTIQVGQLITGNVKSIGIRSSNILTFDGAEVIVPNGQLVSNEVINWTLTDPKRRVEIPVGVSYKSDPQLVHQLLSTILKSHPGVLQDPMPLVFFTGLGESSLDFILLYWISDNNENRRIKSEILFSIFAVLKDNNIEIPFPQRDVHVHSVVGNAAIGKSAPREKQDDDTVKQA